MNEQSHNSNMEDNIEPELEARIIALVLGEASDFETEELHRLIAQRPELAAFKQRMESVHGLLSEVVTGEFDVPSGEWKLSPGKRNAVLAAIRGEATIPAAIQGENPAVTHGMSARRRWRWKLAATLGGACLAGLVGVMAWPSLFDQSPDATLVASNQSDAWEFELRGGTNLTFEVDSINNMDDWYARGFSKLTRIHGMSEDVSIDGREISPADAGSLSSSKASTDALSAIHKTLDAKDTLPGDTYLDDDVQYFDDGPKFKLSNESVVQQATSEQERLSQLSSTRENARAATPHDKDTYGLVATAEDGLPNLQSGVSVTEMQYRGIVALRGSEADVEKSRSLVQELDRKQAVADNDVASAFGLESITENDTAWMLRGRASGGEQESRTPVEKLNITMPEPRQATGDWVEETHDAEVADRLESVLGEVTTQDNKPMSGLQADDGLALLYESESKSRRLSESRDELAAALNQSPIIEGFTGEVNVAQDGEPQTVDPAVDRFRVELGKQSNTSGSPATDLFTLNGESANSQHYNFQVVPETAVPETEETEETEADSALPPIAVPNGGSVTLGGVVRPSVALERQAQENIAAVNVPEMTVTPRIIIGEQEVPLMLRFAPYRASGLFEDGTIRANGQVDSPTTAGGMGGGGFGGGGFGGGGTAANSVASKDSTVRPIELQRSSPAELLGRLDDTLSIFTDVDTDADGLNMPVPETEFITGATIATTESEPSAHPFAVDASEVNAEKEDAIAFFGRANGMAELAGEEPPVIVPAGLPTTAIPELQLKSDFSSLTRQYNELMEQGRAGEAERVAGKARELRPDLPEAIIMEEKAKLQQQIALIEEIKERTKGIKVLNSIDEAMAASIDDAPSPDAKSWSELAARRTETTTRSLNETGQASGGKTGESVHTGGATSAASASIPLGRRVMTIQVAPNTELQPGDNVDLHFSDLSEDQKPDCQVMPLIESVEVFAVDAQGGVGQSEAQSRTRYLSLLVTPEQSMKLTLAEKKGTISAVLRSSNDSTPSDVGNLSKKIQSQLRSTVTKTVPVASLNEQTAAEEAFSTFSLHVSDVSFKLALAALAKGEWPEAAKVRIEEFVNAFDYGDSMPANGEKVACAIEQSIHPFVQQRNMLRVSMRTAAAGRASQTPLRLTFVLDNSGSMERIDRQQTVRRAFAMLAQQLTPIDQVTVISFARQPRLLADKVGGSDAGKLVGLIDELPSEGGTNIEAALQLAFEKAREQQTSSAQNRIILLTDGAVNLGNANPESLSQMVSAMRNSGIAFDAAGISAEGLNDEVLEALARKGDGRYYLLDSQEAADDGFAKQIAGALRPSAKNVKVQVEFNPKRVGHYKLLGFEKHILKKEDFRNDKVDAAEMAAAEAGVAMYQFEALPDGEGDVGSVSVRFQYLATGEMVENRWPIPYEADAARPDQAAPSLRIATSAAMLAAKLKGEPLGESVDLQVLSGLMSGLPEQFRNDTRVQQLQQMIEQARQLSGK